MSLNNKWTWGSVTTLIGAIAVVAPFVDWDFPPFPTTKTFATTITEVKTTIDDKSKLLTSNLELLAKKLELVAENSDKNRYDILDKREKDYKLQLYQVEREQKVNDLPSLERERRLLQDRIKETNDEKQHYDPTRRR